MNEDFIKSVAAQLREPEGEMGLQVGEKMNESNAAMNREAIRLIALKDGDKMLEIGMGNGFFIPEIFNAYPTIHYTGVDASPVMIAEATERNSELLHVDKVKFLQGYASQLPFPDGSFNKVMSVNCIYFWDQPARELESIHRVLVPGGQLLVAIRPKDSMVKMPFTQYGFSLYDQQEITLLLTANGFTVKDSYFLEEPGHEWNGETIILSSFFVLAEK